MDHLPVPGTLGHVDCRSPTTTSTDGRRQSICGERHGGGPSCVALFSPPARTGRRAGAARRQWARWLVPSNPLRTQRFHRNRHPVRARHGQLEAALVVEEPPGAASAACWPGRSSSRPPADRCLRALVRPVQVSSRRSPRRSAAVVRPVVPHPFGRSGGPPTGLRRAVPRVRRSGPGPRRPPATPPPGAGAGAGAGGGTRRRGRGRATRRGFSQPRLATNRPGPARRARGRKAAAPGPRPSARGPRSVAPGPRSAAPGRRSGSPG